MLKIDLAALGEITPSRFAAFCSALEPEWLEQSMKAITGGADAKLRNRKLPPALALWLVIGMALFRDRSIKEVAAHLELVVGPPGTPISPGALPPALARLGAGPMQHLFDVSAQHWADQSTLPCQRWRDLSLWAMDGTCFNAPDTVENAAAFDRATNGSGSGPFPKLRAVVLLNARTHVVLGMNVSGYQEGELSLLKPLWERLPDHSLVTLDRGLQSWWEYAALTAAGTERHWLTRAKKNLACTVIKKLGPNDCLVKVPLNDKRLRKLYPEAPETMVLRHIRVVRRGFRPIDVLTSLLDSEKYPAKEVAAMYVERWEIELAYDEIKTHLLETKVTLRSKRPEGLLQEVYGIAIAYNLVRMEMARVAAEHRCDPRRLSFRHAAMLIRNFLLGAWATSPGALPRRLASFESDLALLLLPERRQRSYPRQRKFKDTRYPPKKRSSRSPAK